jgi:hypothetical protein
MKFKSLLHSALLLPVLLSTTLSHAQSVPISEGMNYALARQRLVQAGWKPLVSLVPAAQWIQEGNNKQRQYHMSAQKDLASYFRNRGWHETLDCAPTGHGMCRQQFFHTNGKSLIVATTSGQGTQPPLVKSDGYGDGTR